MPDPSTDAREQRDPWPPRFSVSLPAHTPTGYERADVVHANVYDDLAVRADERSKMLDEREATIDDLAACLAEVERERDRLREAGPLVVADADRAHTRVRELEGERQDFIDERDQALERAGLLEEEAEKAHEDCRRLQERLNRVTANVCPNGEVCKSCPCAGEDDVCFPGERLRADLERAREALEFYADEANWHERDVDHFDDTTGSYWGTERIPVAARPSVAQEALAALAASSPTTGGTHGSLTSEAGALDDGASASPTTTTEDRDGE